MYIVSFFFFRLVTVTAVDLFVLLLVLLPGFLDVRLVALSQSIFVVVASVLDVLAVGAGNGGAIARLWLAYVVRDRH